jgi:hypothetical protein
MPTLSPGQWKTLFGMAAAVCAFLLVQTDVALVPLVKVSLGSLITALAILNPDRG